MNASCSGTLAKYCHVILVTTKGLDVLLHPSQCQNLVLQSLISRSDAVFQI